MQSLAALVVAGWIVYALYAGLGLQRDPPLKLAVGDVVFNVLLVLAAVVCLLRAILLPGSRTGWLALGTGMGVWALGMVYWTLFGKPPSPSAADVLWLSFYPFAFVGFVLLASTRLERLPASTWLDGVIAGLSVASVGAAVVLPSILDAAFGTPAAIAMNLAFPLADLVMIAFVVAMFAVLDWRPGHAWLLIGAGLVTFSMADSIYLYRVATDAFVEGTLLDATWPVGLTFLAFAAWQPPARARPARLSGWQSVALPTAFTVVAFVLLVYGNLAGIDRLALVLASGALLAALLRVVVAFQETQVLSESHRIALTDDLTGLKSRRVFLDALDSRIKQARRRDEAAAVLIADLDGFKELNDTFGHHAGDLLLRDMGARLRGAVVENETVARLGGDEFALLIADADPSSVKDLVQRVSAALSAPFVVEHISMHVHASIGVAIFPDHGTDSVTLLQHADVAMYQAKESRVDYEVYASDRDPSNRHKLALIGDLPRGLRAGELVLHYQPQIELSTGCVVGTEALVRWQHPSWGLLSAGEFVPMAERTGLMREFTFRVLESALAQLREWRDEGIELTMAVNLSLPNMLDVNLAENVRELLGRFGLDPRCLQLEVTENLVMADPDRASAVLADLSALRVRLSLDDFGTGHSSLARVSGLPIQELKIDKSFVIGMCDDGTKAAIVRSTIGLAQELGLVALAEGVETEADFEILRQWGCELAQGRYMSGPLPAASLRRWLERRQLSSRPVGRDRSAGGTRPLTNMRPR